MVYRRKKRGIFLSNVKWEGWIEKKNLKDALFVNTQILLKKGVQDNS